MNGEELVVFGISLPFILIALLILGYAVCRKLGYFKLSKTAQRLDKYRKAARRRRLHYYTGV